MLLRPGVEPARPSLTQVEGRASQHFSMAVLWANAAPLVPKLQGFALQGFFEADVYARVDFANLDALDLGG